MRRYQFQVTLQLWINWVHLNLVSNWIIMQVKGGLKLEWAYVQHVCLKDISHRWLMVQLQRHVNWKKYTPANTSRQKPGHITVWCMTKWQMTNNTPCVHNYIFSTSFTNTASDLSGSMPDERAGCDITTPPFAFARLLLTTGTYK